MNYDEEIINFIFEDDDGALLDIYVLHTMLDDWQKVIDALRESSYTVSFSEVQHAAPLPQHAAALFIRNEDEYPSGFLQVQIDRVRIRCNFFSVEEIEFYLDPIQVTGVEQAEAVVHFMQMINQATGKEVILTPESYQANVLIRVSGDTVQFSRGLHG